jgi:hypothetical protein
MCVLYDDFIAKLEDLGFEFPCEADQFYSRACFFIYDPMFVGSDYLAPNEMTPGWQAGLVHYLCERGGVDYRV